MHACNVHERTTLWQSASRTRRVDLQIGRDGMDLHPQRLSRSRFLSGFLNCIRFVSLAHAEGIEPSPFALEANWLP